VEEREQNGGKRGAKEHKERQLLLLCNGLDGLEAGAMVHATNKYMKYTLHAESDLWGVILTLTLHNNDTTPRHNGVGSMCGPHFIVPWCCVIVV
jgi:hypothetical protein